MKNSVILLPNFHVWCQEVVKFSLKLSLKLSLSVKVSMKISRLLDTTRENSARWYIKTLIPVYRKFRYFRGWYDMIRYIDIESIFPYFRYIEASLIRLFGSSSSVMFSKLFNIRCAPKWRSICHSTTIEDTKLRTRDALKLVKYCLFCVWLTDSQPPILSILLAFSAQTRSDRVSQML